MPELPEVETVRLQLIPNIVGKVIDEIEILEKKQFVGNPKDIIGKKIIGVTRAGKILNVKLNNDKFINIHLKLTGQLLYSHSLKHSIFTDIIPFTKTNRMPANTTRIIVGFKNGSGLFFNDLRKFGWFKISEKPETPKGVDVLSRDFTLNFLRQIVKLSHKPIKLFLIDQDKIAGIGNIYANEALFLSKIYPLRLTNLLNEKEIRDLYEAIKIVIGEGLKHHGSSGADEAFVQPDGTRGKHQRYFLVYQQEGKLCPICKNPIKRIKQGGRSSFFCIKCQRP